jgi:cytochrome oxidase assembly protein ShyY1
MNGRRLGFGLFTLAMVAAFVGLGIWQLQRRVEKHALIAALSERLAAEPVPLPPVSEWNSLAPAKDEFRRVRFSAALDPTAHASVYTSGSALRDDISGPGTWEFWPATLPDGHVVAVNMGFVADPANDHSAGAGSMTKSVISLPSQVTGYIRFPESAGLLTPSADLGKRLWFTRDHLAMAQALGWGGAGKTVAPFYIDLEQRVSSSVIPKPGPLHVHLKDDHLQYAITWFALAGAIVIAFVVSWHGRRNRQDWDRRSQLSPGQES